VCKSVGGGVCECVCAVAGPLTMCVQEAKCVFVRLSTRGEVACYVCVCGVCVSVCVLRGEVACYVCRVWVCVCVFGLRPAANIC